jgi:hypothetical protein
MHLVKTAAQRRNGISTLNMEMYTNDAYENEFVNLETSSFAEVTRTLIMGLGMMLLLGVGTYLVGFVLSAVLAALLF